MIYYIYFLDSQLNFFSLFWPYFYRGVITTTFSVLTLFVICCYVATVIIEINQLPILLFIADIIGAILLAVLNPNLRL